MTVVVGSDMSYDSAAALVADGRVLAGLGFATRTAYGSGAGAEARAGPVPPDPEDHSRCAAPATGPARAPTGGGAAGSGDTDPVRSGNTSFLPPPFWGEPPSG